MKHFGRKVDFDQGTSGGCRRVVMQCCGRFVADGVDALDVLDVAAVVAEG